MERMKTSTLLFAFGLALSSISYAQPFKVSVVAVESTEEFKSWLGKRIDPARQGGDLMPPLKREAYAL